MSNIQGSRMERVLITMPPAFLDDVDDYAEEHYLSRSQLIRKALEEYIYEDEEDEE